MPLDEHIEGGHGEREPGVKIRPDPVHDSLEMADDGQHREHRLDEHAILPLPPLTQFEIARIPLGGMEGGIAGRVGYERGPLLAFSPSTGSPTAVTHRRLPQNVA